MKYVIGLTGGIGSGKTTVASIIAEQNYPVYNSDARAKDLVHRDIELKSQIISLLGDSAYTASGEYNRKWVASQVFEDSQKLRCLNALIHPAVRRDFDMWVARQTMPLVFKETALLFELGLHQNCARTILVTADQSIRIKRVMDRDNKTYREVEAIISRQMSEQEKIRHADFIIYNNEGLEKLRNSVEETLLDLYKSLYLR